jgi:phosphoribosylformylglycinamidine cyclo-ligase
MNYEQAGVDINKGDLFVKNIASMVKSSFNNNVKNDLTQFSALYDVGPFYLSACTDGVGTKLMLAMELNQHKTIGQDLVAMNVNDLICNGSKPIFFLDYIACHKLDMDMMQDIVYGITESCKAVGAAVIGGETAEMNDLYAKNHYDLAGFAIGMLDKDKLIDGSNIQEGDELLSLSANGFHSNGFSLIRKLINKDENELKNDLLIPTPLYVNTIQMLIENFRDDIHGIANITGGGIHNICRMNSKFKYDLDNLPKLSELPKSMQTIIQRSNLEKEQLYKTFNMGLGMVLAVKDAKKISSFLMDAQIKHKIIGKVIKGSGINF